LGTVAALALSAHCSSSEDLSSVSVVDQTGGFGGSSGGIGGASGADASVGVGGAIDSDGDSGGTANGGAAGGIDAASGGAATPDAHPDSADGTADAGIEAGAEVSADATADSGAALQNVFIIVMTKFVWSTVKESGSAKYINQLLNLGAHAEQYYTPPGNHPSEPNFIWMEAGDNLGITADGTPAAISSRTPTAGSFRVFTTISEFDVRDRAQGSPNG
jgi:hypothetical protein